MKISSKHLSHRQNRWLIFIKQSFPRDVEGNRQQNPSQYCHSLCRDLNGLVLRTDLGQARKRNPNLQERF